MWSEELPESLNRTVNELKRILVETYDDHYKMSRYALKYILT